MTESGSHLGHRAPTFFFTPPIGKVTVTVMARNRTPTAKAEVSGAALIHPGRFKDRKGPKRIRPVGEPYAAMDEVERGCWAEYVENLPWLNSGHRTVLLMTCRLTAAMLKGEEFGVSKMQSLSSLLSKLGATPVDETKVNHGDGGDEPDSSEAFFTRPN